MARRCLVASVVALLPATVLGAPPASAAQPAGVQTNIVLDLSGSMKDPAGNGVSRIDAAKAAVKTTVKAVPDKAKIGLRTFGACKTTTQVIPVDTVDRDRIGSAVDALRPNGDTPLALALEKAGADFPAGDERKSVLLVSDGEETCGGDPVAAVSKLPGICKTLKVDVVGFLADAATKQQLLKIAAAGCGEYFDASDSAALTARMARASLRSMRELGMHGRDVTGSPDPAKAPMIDPGVYRDMMPAGHEVKRFWAFTMPAGATAHVSVSLADSTPIGTPWKGGQNVWVGSPDNDFCESDSRTVDLPKGGAAIWASGVQVTTGKGENGCGNAGRWFIGFENDEQTRTTPAPIEITLLIESPAGSTANLPKTYQAREKEQWPALTVSGSALAVTGGGTFGDAPSLNSGVYADTVRPGETVFYRVPIGWGQRLVARARFPEADAKFKALFTNSAGVDVWTSVFNPTRRDVALESSRSFTWYDGDATDATVLTAPVRYNNRLRAADDLSDKAKVARTDIPGYYYVAIEVSSDSKINMFDVPIEIDLQVFGTVQGAPKYQSAAGTTDPMSYPGLAAEIEKGTAYPGEKNGQDGDKHNADGDGDGNGLLIAALAVGGGVLGLALLGGVLLAVMLRRRRTG